MVAAAPSPEPNAGLARNAQALRDAGATVLWYVYTRNGSVPCCECCEDLDDYIQDHDYVYILFYSKARRRERAVCLISTPQFMSPGAKN